MENKEIKRTRPESHDCNLCKCCQESIKNSSYNYCSACHFLFFEKLYKDFSSGNQEVDKIIKNPIYIPPKSNNEYEYKNNELNYYQWIPWDCLSNINEIARGGFGIIYKATLIDGLINKNSIKHYGEMEHKKRKTEEVAIKIMPTNSSEVFKELNILRAIEINNNGKYLHYISSIWGITQNAETLDYGIVMEFAEHGDMRKYLSTNFHSISWSHKLKIASYIAHGLCTIHSSGMVHRDLHSGNILQLSKNIVTIGDLGLCQSVNNNEATTTEEKKIYGVIPYIPPEVLRGEKFTSAGDIYSFAMLLWELATGKPPFHDRSHDHLLIMDILNGKRPEITYPLIPPCIAKLIEKCWDVNPENRLNAWEVYSNLGKFLSSRSSFSSDFIESNKCVREMLENESTTNYSTTTTSTRIHPGAVYTSRLLTAQMIDFSKEFVFLPKDDS
ncbi:hypothetical protein G9A89_008685 [Geosiphon pyriformis]|nr:hypothetical protein G9A89_008685 [Geosiphon pyriformis]